MNPHTAAKSEATPKIYQDPKFSQRQKTIDDAIDRSDINCLIKIAVKLMNEPVNLSGDTLLMVLIAYGRKSDLAIRLIQEPGLVELKKQNYDQDTALHVAAMMGDTKVAKELLEKEKELLNMRNRNTESALHKAALYGKSDIFWMLANIRGAEVKGRRMDGGTVLHCAIMGNAPKLALDIAVHYQDLMTTRNNVAVTPLQLMVTIPDAFRSKMYLGPLEATIYDWLPLPLEGGGHPRTKQSDDVENQSEKPVEAADDANDLDNVGEKTVEAANDSECIHFLTKYQKKFPPNYDALFDMLSFAHHTVSLGARWIQLLLFGILKQSFVGVTTLEQQKINHTQAMKLVEFLAKDPGYWDFIVKGTTGTESKDNNKIKPQKEPIPITDSSGNTHGKSSMTEDDEDNDDKKKKLYMEWLLEVGEKMGLNEFVESIRKAFPQSDSKRWDESPLTLGAKLGLYEFVKTILNVCPQSAVYIDHTDRNILQVAIENGQKEIVGIVGEMATGPNPKLPSCLLSNVDKAKNTILHFAAEKMVKDGAGAQQMQKELQWFEEVKKMLPKDLEYSRNATELTAQELFTEKHKDMIKESKTQLMDMGKTGAGLVAAVVFASSFSIPGDKDDTTHLPIFYHRLAFKVFTHAYVFGISCASTALVLFLSLLTSPYKEQDFRRSIPTKYFFANASFFVGMISLLVAFTCNIYLTIYGAAPDDTKNVFPLVGELISVPILCSCVLVYRGATFGIMPFLRHFWR